MKNPLQHLTDRVRGPEGSRPDDHEDAHDVLVDDRPAASPGEPAGASALAADGVEVRRNGTLAAVVGGVAGVVALVWLVRALGSGSLLDWAVVVLIGAVAVAHLVAAVDARTPLLVADRTGIRLRLGRTWQGLPWEQLEEVEHAPRQGLLQDGRIVAFPADPDAVLGSLEPAARRQAAVAERLHGAPFAVPLGFTTRTVGAPDGLTAALLALAPDPDLVVEVVPDATEAPDDTTTVTDTVERVRPEVGAPRSAPAPDQGAPVASPTPSPTPSPLRHSIAAVRSEVTRVITGHRDEDPQAHRPRPETPEYFATAVRTDADDAGPSGPTAEPVVGPQLAAAREAIGLDVERLAERTRIRPHVIEAIEVDDFEPCGGDFYARGHLRTLSRVLGVDATPLLATYDEIYADAPIDPRRVFEAELATGSDGAIRSLRGGPNWSVLVAGVMALVLAWSVARLVLDRSDPTPDSPSMAGDSAGLTGASTDLAPAVPVVLTAQGGGAKVVVRDGGGKVVFKGDLAFGQSKTLKASPPVRVQTSDGSLTVGIDGEKATAMGRTGASARNTFVPRVD